MLCTQELCSEEHTHPARENPCVDLSPWLRYTVMWLVGLDLRITLLAVPPVLTLIHRDLHLTETQVAALSGLPVILLAAGALPGSLLIARAGARRAAITGILLTGVASGLRGIGPSASMLFGMTLLMAIGIAITQPAAPSLIGRWLPERIGTGTALYTNGLLVGELLSVSLTLPVVLPLLGNRWTWSFAFWGGLVLLSALPITWLSRGLPDAAANPHARWWPDWEKAETWRLGLLMGGLTSAYFGANAFLPDFLEATGRSRLIGECLTVLNASQLPASLIGVAAGAALAGHRRPLLIFSAALFPGVGAFLMKPDWAVVLGTGVLGFCLALLLTLTLALPPLLARPGDVHRLSGGMFAVAYVFSFVAQIGTGKFWDATHFAATAVLPVALGALTALIAVAGLPPAVTNWEVGVESSAEHGHERSR